MGMTIRRNCFETNSSSTHSLCLIPEGWKEWKTNIDYESPRKEIIVEEPLKYKYRTAVITTSNFYKRGGGYYLVRGDLEKIQFIVSCMSEELNTIDCSLAPHQLKPFQIIYETINKYLKKKYDINYTEVKISEKYEEGNFIYRLIGWSWDKEVPFTEEQIEKIINRVISDDSIVFTCHSDETGPFPEDCGLIGLDLKTLI